MFNLESTVPGPIKRYVGRDEDCRLRGPGRWQITIGRPRHKASTLPSRAKVPKATRR
jgi:hypothetical protein